MAFDPALPVADSEIESEELRNQFNGLKALLDAQAAATAFGRVAADWTSGTASFADVGGLGWTVAVGESWTAELVLAVVSGTSGQGFRFRVAGPAAGAVLISIQGTGVSSATTVDCEVQTAFSVASPAKTFCAGSTLSGVVRVHVVVVNAGAAGSVQLQAANSSGSGTVTIKAGSDVVGRRTG